MESSLRSGIFSDSMTHRSEGLEDSDANDCNILWIAVIVYFSNSFVYLMWIRDDGSHVLFD
jgi:hypothetical protein